MSRPLTQTQSTEHRTKLRELWNWDGGYWHPLKPQAFPNLIALDGLKLEALLPEEEFRSVLESASTGAVLLFHEYLEDIETTIHEMPHCYGWSEALLASPSFAWVVYWSHENTIALGGEAIVSAFKRSVPRWESTLWLP